MSAAPLTMSSATVSSAIHVETSHIETKHIQMFNVWSGRVQLDLEAGSETHRIYVNSVATMKHMDADSAELRARVIGESYARVQMVLADQAEKSEMVQTLMKDLSKQEDSTCKVVRWEVLDMKLLTSEREPVVSVSSK